MTTEELAEKIKNTYTYVTHYRCGACDCPVGYILDRGQVEFDSNCDCVRYTSPNQQRTLDDFVEFYNSSNSIVKAQIDQLLS